MAATPIKTEGLSKRYDETLALDGLDLELQPGEVYGYLGPNGAGKTTTIRLLLALLAFAAASTPAIETCWSSASSSKPRRRCERSHTATARKCS